MYALPPWMVDYHLKGHLGNGIQGKVGPAHLQTLADAPTCDLQAQTTIIVPANPLSYSEMLTKSVGRSHQPVAVGNNETKVSAMQYTQVTTGFKEPLAFLAFNS